MSLDTALPPALFDLEEPATEPITIGRRPGHTIRVYNTPTGPLVYCACGDHSPARANTDAVTRWAYAHLGIEYDTAVDEAVNR